MSAWYSWPSSTGARTETWLHSYVTEDKFYCVSPAPAENSMREYCRTKDVPTDRIAAVRRLIHPAGRS